jgi:hypothetical protein
MAINFAIRAGGPGTPKPQVRQRVAQVVRCAGGEGGYRPRLLRRASENSAVATLISRSPREMSTVVAQRMSARANGGDSYLAS